MGAERDPFLGRKVGQALGGGSRGARRHLHVPRATRGGGEPPQLGVQELDPVHLGTGALGDHPQVYGVLHRHRVEGEQGLGVHLEAVLGGGLGHDDGGVDHGDVVLRLPLEAAGAGQLPEVVHALAVEAAPHLSFARVVRGEREVPVLEHVVERAQVLRGGAGGLLRAAPLVDPPVLLQAESLAGGGHELPNALGLRPRERAGLEGALDEGDVGQVLRDAFRVEDLADTGQVAPAAGERFGKPVAQGSLVEVDAGQYLVVQLDLDVVALGPQRLFRHPPGLLARRAGGHGQVGDVVDRRRFGQRLAEPVPRRQRFELAELDGFQRPLVGFGHARVRVCPARGVQVQVEGLVELFPGAVEVTGAALVGSPGQACVGRGDQPADGVFRGPGGVTGRGAERSAAGATRCQGANGNEQDPLPWPGHSSPPRQAGSENEAGF